MEGQSTDAVTERSGKDGAASLTASSVATAPNEITPGPNDAEEYETQFFKFTPQSFSDGLYNAMASYILESLQKLNQCLLEEFPELVTPEQTQKACDMIFPKVTKALEAAFDKLTGYLSLNIFRIPSHVILPEDALQHKFPTTQEGEKAVIDEIDKIKKDIIQARLYNARLKQEIQDLAILEDKWAEMLKEIQGAKDNFCKNGVISLEDAMANLSSLILQSMESIKNLPPQSQKRSLISEEDDLPDEQNNTIKRLCPEQT